MKKIIKKILLFILGLVISILVFLASLLWNSVTWMFEVWSNLSVDELIFHLKAPLEGTNAGLLTDYMSRCLSISILIVLFFIIGLIVIRKKKQLYRVLYQLIAFVIALSCIGGSLWRVWTGLDLKNYTKNQTAVSAFIDDNYVSGNDVSIVFPEQKRNLIYIYLESMEDTYSDKENGGAFDEDVIPELTKISEESENFSGGDATLNGASVMPGSSWTMAGIFAQTAGLPLDIPIEGNSMDTQETFFPSIVTLGDILEKEGYNQTFLCGSNVSFGGRKLYLQTHGDFNFSDYSTALEQEKIPKGYSVWWGYEDKKLFEFAKEELTEIAKSDQPFNYTMLTADSHFEDGYICEDCEETFGDNQYANAIACSSKKVSEFITWIQNQDFYENTTIVIAGDHLTMDSDFCDNIDSDYQRKTINAYINSAVQPERNDYREYTTYDNYPTTLASLGVTIEGNRLGLGTNLFSVTPTLVETYGENEVSREVQRKSKLMDELMNEQNFQGYGDDEGSSPTTAEVMVSPYDYNTGELYVTIANINTSKNIQTISAAVWTEGDQSDTQWIEAIAQSDGTYLISIDIEHFQYKTGNYQVEVYALDDGGGTEIIGSIVGEVN